MNTSIFSSSSKAAVVSASSSRASFSDASASSDVQSASNLTFAAGELDGVFRIGSTNDSASSRNDDHLARDSSLRRRRFIAPSFNTDGEMSTFSEEENDASDAFDNHGSVSSGSGGIHLPLRQNNRRNIFYPSRRVKSPLSDIFRMPISGAKRQCEDMMTDDDLKVDNSATRPLLCRANHICSSDDNSDEPSTTSTSDESLDQVMSSPRSSKRMCLSRNDSPSSYISLFSVTSPATIDYRGADSVIITPKSLEHPLASSGSLMGSIGVWASWFAILRRIVILFCCFHLDEL